MKRWVFIAVMVFVLGVIAKAPAQLLPVLVRSAGVDLAAFAVSGSVWQGQITGAVIHTAGKSIFIDKMTWELKPAQLFLGDACLSLDVDYQQLPVATDVCVSVMGTVTIDKLFAKSEVAPMLDALGFPFPIDGSVSLAIDHAQWNRSEGVIAMEGQAVAKDYAYHVANEYTVLGDYRINLSHVAGKLLLNFTPSQALIDLDGKILVDPLGSYYAQLSFIPSANASAALINSLQFIAARQNDSTFKLEYKGKF